MITRDQAKDDARKLMDRLFKGHDNSKAAKRILEYLDQESDEEVREEIADLLRRWNTQTGNCGLVYTAFSNTYGLIQNGDPVDRYHIVVNRYLTLTELRDKLIEMTKPYVPTNAEVSAAIERIRLANKFIQKDDLDLIDRYVEAQVKTHNEE